VSTSLVSIPLFPVVMNNDPLEIKVAESKHAVTLEAARKELDDLLCDGWREIGSGTTMTPSGVFLCIVLFKNEGLIPAQTPLNEDMKRYRLEFQSDKMSDEQIAFSRRENIYLHPVDGDDY
jgi:hypothetical protein